ncbi:MAG: site-2 protease family protein, partial [Thermodesulfobacteriota bacterium]
MTAELEQLDGFTSTRERQRSEGGSALLPASLFAATVVTTLASGALQQGLDIFHNPSTILQGYPFSIAIIAILGTHELGHFFASKRHRVVTTVPYFIPGPPLPPMVGTFGAVIRIKSPIVHRTALIDIGAAGPIAGFIVSIAVTVWGLALSPVLPAPSGEGHIIFGSSLIFHALSFLVLGPIPAGYDIFLHPVAFAGWIGFFITCMNLLPIGQLDGGHVLYALLRK